MWTQDQSNNNYGPNEVPSFMNTLTSCINKVVKDGYSESFNVTKKGLFSTSKETYYRPEQVRVINFYRFEGQSDPADNAIMYVIETDDGLKGTIIDAYGTYADDSMNKFMAQVEEINKKVIKSDPGTKHEA